MSRRPEGLAGHDRDLDRLEQDFGEFRGRVRNASTERTTEEPDTLGKQ